MSVLIFGIEPYLNNPELWKRAMLKADDSHLLKADNNHKNKVIINDEIKGIKQNISASYGYSAARVLHALQTVGHTERHLLGIDIDAVLKRIADSNALLYGKNRKNWPAGGYGQRRYNYNSGRNSSGNEGSLG